MRNLFIIMTFLTVVAIHQTTLWGEETPPCCQGPGCPICDPFIPEPEPDEPYGPPDPRGTIINQIHFDVGDIANALFWWLRH